MDATDYYAPTITTYDYTSPYAGVDMGMYWFISLIIWVISIVAYWRVFEKAGKPGWAAIVPIYNIYVLVKIAGRPGWWLLLLLIPFVNVVIWLVLALDVAKAFGKSVLFGVVGLWLFSLIGYMILGFGNAKYIKPKTS